MIKEYENVPPPQKVVYVVYNNNGTIAETFLDIKEAAKYIKKHKGRVLDFLRKYYIW